MLRTITVVKNNHVLGQINDVLYTSEKYLKSDILKYKPEKIVFSFVPKLYERLVAFNSVSVDKVFICGELAIDYKAKDLDFIKTRFEILTNIKS